MSESNHLLILDFDGTMTDAELEGAPYRTGYLEDLAILCGRDRDEVLEMGDRFEDEVKGNPDGHGWVFQGHIVAPASVDPYLRIMPVARKIMDVCGVFENSEERTRLLDGILYKYNYTKTANAFRPNAGSVLRSLKGTNTFIVTNSHTDPVQAKVRELGGEAGELDWLVERVNGSAKKYAIDDAFDNVPQSLQIDGLSRPVLLRRQLYHECISRLLSETGADWSELVVVGDIFELDLALPLAMGARIGLVANQFTPEYEIAFVANHERGRLITDLEQVLDFIL